MTKQNQEIEKSATSTTSQVAKQPVNLKSLLEQDSVKKKFETVLGEDANGFMANLSVMVNNSEALRQCEAMTIITSAIIASSLKLPLDPNLGFAAIVPFNKKEINGSFKRLASFQMMYKGYIQLSIRTGQYKTINVTEVYADELLKHDPFTGEVTFTDSKLWKMRYDTTGKGVVVGFYAYFKLLSGFEKPLFFTKEEIEKHGKKYSQTFKKGYGLWVDNFVAMGKKTVLKSLLSKWGIMSIEMQTAIKNDSAVVHDLDDSKIEYIDNNETNEDIINEKANQATLSFDNAEVIDSETTVKEPTQPLTEEEKLLKAGEEQKAKDNNPPEKTNTKVNNHKKEINKTLF